MSDLRCACGYQATGRDDIDDHLGEAFIPSDDTAPDGLLHAEASLAECRCLCGFSAGAIAELDVHLLAAFTPADAIGNDGRLHVLRPG